MKESILFWPVQLKGNILYILDETKIPFRISYLKVRNYKEAIRAVVNMKTRAFGQFLTVCYAFIQALQKTKDKSKAQQFNVLKKVARAFNKSRPTFPFEEVTAMILRFAQKVYPSPDFKEDFIRVMQDFLEKGIRGKRYQRAKEAARLIKDGDTVLTHCHVSGELSLIAEICRKDRKKVRFFATETRPYFQGSRLTAWELKKQGFGVTLIPDNAVANVMAEGIIDCVIVGCDRCARNGDFANKIGTLQIALLARHFHIPFYVLSQISDKIQKGKDIPIEVRSEKEVLTYEGRRLAAKGVRAFYPGFDVTDHRLVTKHIVIHAN